MECKNCKSTNSKVIDSRKGLEYNQRLRICLKCMAKFKTYEFHEADVGEEDG